MGTKFLMDTNSVLDYFKDNLPTAGADFMDELVNTKPQISVITEIETLGFNGNPAEMSLISDFISDSIVFELDRSIVECTIALRSSYKVKLPMPLLRQRHSFTILPWLRATWMILSGYPHSER